MTVGDEMAKRILEQLSQQDEQALLSATQYVADKTYKVFDQAANMVADRSPLLEEEFASIRINALNILIASEMHAMVGAAASGDLEVGNGVEPRIRACLIGFRKDIMKRLNEWVFQEIYDEIDRVISQVGPWEGTTH